MKGINELKQKDWIDSVLYPKRYTKDALRYIDKLSERFNKEYDRKMLIEQSKTKREEIVYRRGFREGLKMGLRLKLHTNL